MLDRVFTSCSILFVVVFVSIGAVSHAASKPASAARVTNSQAPATLTAGKELALKATVRAKPRANVQLAVFAQWNAAAPYSVVARANRIRIARAGLKAGVQVKFVVPADTAVAEYKLFICATTGKALQKLPQKTTGCSALRLQVVAPVATRNPVEPPLSAPSGSGTTGSPAPDVTTTTPTTTSPPPLPPLPFQLTSSAFLDGAVLPETYGCKMDRNPFDDTSVPLRWVNPPAGTQSFAILMTDPDAGNFVHWGVGNLGAGVSELRPGVVPAGAFQSDNHFGGNGYGSPCPPMGTTHTYEMRVFALNAATVSFSSNPAMFVREVAARMISSASIHANYTGP